MNLKWIFISAALSISINSYSKEINISGSLYQKDNDAAFLSIPFHLASNLIIVEAFVDGQKGNYIIDTGTKSMVLNSKYFSGRINSKNRAYDFSGSSMVYKERVVKFNWKNKKIKTYPAAVVSLASLEEIIGEEIMGYIGYEILKEYEIVIDYTNRNLTLYQLGKKGKRKNSQLSHVKLLDSITLKPNGHLPYLMVHLGGQKLKLGIDSGASVNLIKTSATKKMWDHFRPNGFQSTAGFTGNESLSTHGVLHKLTIENTSWSPMKCVLKDMNDLNRTLPTSLDGLLGFEFLKQYKISINYRKNKMYIWHPEKLQPVAITAR